MKYNNCRFKKEKEKIDLKYDEIEMALIEQFKIAQSKDDFKRMKEIATVLSNFKGYSTCINEYIKFSQTVILKKRGCLSFYYICKILGLFEAQRRFCEFITVMQKKLRSYQRSLQQTRTSHG